MNNTFVRQVLPILLAIGLLWYVLKDVPLNELSAQFRQANFQWLGVAGIIIGTYHIARAARWQLTLQALGYQPSLFRTTIALLAGTMASMIIPGAGELTRCGTLQRTDSVPIAQGLGSVVAERIIDLLTLVLLIGLTLFFEFKRVGQFITDLFSPLLSRMTSSGQSSIILVVVAGISILLFIFFYWLLRNQTFRQHPLSKRLGTIALNMGKGFIAIQKLRSPSLFIGLTIASYTLAFLITYTLFFASSQTMSLPPSAALTILTVSSLGGIAVPTQGGVGTYHFLVSRVLMLYGMDETASVVMATFLHASQTGFSLLFSSISFLIVPVLIRQKAKQVEV
jgi:uncharacterized protein (TIRG00374 family)